MCQEICKIDVMKDIRKWLEATENNRGNQVLSKKVFVVYDNIKWPKFLYIKIPS